MVNQLSTVIVNTAKRLSDPFAAHLNKENSVSFSRMIVYGLYVVNNHCFLELNAQGYYD